MIWVEFLKVEMEQEVVQMYEQQVEVRVGRVVWSWFYRGRGRGSSEVGEVG